MNAMPTPAANSHFHRGMWWCGCILLPGQYPCCPGQLPGCPGQSEPPIGCAPTSTRRRDMRRASEARPLILPVVRWWLIVWTPSLPIYCQYDVWSNTVTWAEMLLDCNVKCCKRCKIIINVNILPLSWFLCECRIWKFWFQNRFFPISLNLKFISAFVPYHTDCNICVAK